MYAALASRSIGTRLLLTYARVAFPTMGELSAIKMPIFYNATDTLRRKFRASDAETPFEADHQDPPGAHEGAAEEPTADQYQHFRRFLQEAPRWLVYDTWARACMSF